MDRAAMEWARKTVIALDAAELSPAAVIFLLRSYVTDGGDAVRDAAEQGLTRGLASAPPSDTCTRLEWLRTLLEAAALSDDERLREIVAQTLPAAVDALEALVRRSYEPGEGLMDAGCDEHMQMGSALLAAFDLCGRLPYAMLAEELVQHARRLWWRDVSGAFDAGYRRAAVVAPVASYVEDARRLAASLSGRAGEYPQHAAGFGRALLEWFALEPNLQ
jgi:hypothetical protein